MTDIAIILCAIAWGWFMGFVARDMRDQLSKLKDKLASYQPKDETPEPPKSVIVEPPTPEQQAVKDMQERIKRVNGAV